MRDPHKMKQLIDERSHINDMYKILYIKTEYIDILDSVSVTTEEPISDSEPTYTYDDSLIDNIYTYKYDDSLIDNTYTYKYDEVEASSPKIKQDIFFTDNVFENIMSYAIDKNPVEYEFSGDRTNTKQKFKVKNVKVQYIDNKLFRIEGDITKSPNFIELRRFANTTICEAFTPEEEQSNDWRRDKTSKIYKQYEIRDKAYTFINDSYQNFKFVKNAFRCIS